ncbi:MAG: CRISPR-associated endonuclease Cas1 [Planctomycetales bacterium]|nr:CRISPR-associated endonuclease Cas1 [Planctomycetales bacterium]
MQLVINTRGTSLRRRKERFLLRCQDIIHEFAAAKIDTIVIATGVHFTSDVIQLANQHNVDIVFLDKSGMPTSRVWQCKLGSTASIRRRQLEVAETDEGLQIAAEWVGGKTDNQVRFLTELAKRRPNEKTDIESVITSLNDLRQKIGGLSGVVSEQRGTLMGWEGTAGRIYFDCLAKILPAEYRFSGRSRQPAVDPFNAMLNYGYGVLYSQVEIALILAGLDPFIGFLHTDNYNKRSLVFDMIEPFRIIAERATVLFFTGRRVKKEFFREVPGGIELAPDGRAALISNLNERLDKAVKYPVQRVRKPGGKKFRRVKLRATIQHEAHALANRLLGRNDLPKIVDSDSLFAEGQTDSGSTT